MRLFQVLLYSLIFSFSYSSADMTSCGKPELNLITDEADDSYSEVCAYPYTYTEGEIFNSINCSLNREFYTEYIIIGELGSHGCASNKVYWSRRNFYKYYGSECPVDKPYIDENNVCTDTQPIPDMDDDSDGIPNKCDSDYADFDSMDCDGDSVSNDSDNDLDGDFIPNDYDSAKGVPLTLDEIENAPTCSEMEAISEKKCLYPLRWEFDCEHPLNGGRDYVTKDICPTPASPCMEFTDTLTRNCNPSTHDIIGSCADDGVTITRNDQKCVERITELTAEDCSRSWNEVFNPTTKQCECESGYTLNTWGDCWKSPIDANSTADEISLDERNQDLNHEAKAKEVSTNQQQADSIASAEKSNVANETTNNTLGGIRDDIAKSNEFLENTQNNDNRRDDLLTEIKDLLSSDSNSSSDSGNLDFLADSVDSILSKYTIDLTNGSCGAISTVSANILNQNVVFLSQDTIDMLPMDYMKSIVIFLFTVSALILAFRGGD
ncbi:hypothetical protein [Sulfurimonas sp.]